MTRVSRGDRDEPELDDVSKRIIEQLQEDGRRSYTEIARSVGLSEAAVRQRVQRLGQTGVIQIAAITDPMQLGFRRQAMVGLRVAGVVEDVADRLAELDAVDYVLMTTGRFDLIIEVVCADDDEFIDLLDHHIRVLSEVRSTETFMYLRLVKQTYKWGTR